MSDIKNKVEKINEYIKRFMWMDFSYEKISDNEIRIIGGLDLSWKDICIDIVFEKPVNIMTILSEWHRNDEKPFIELATKEEAINNIKYFGEGCFIFKINAEGYDTAPIWIVAKSIDYDLKTK